MKPVVHGLEAKYGNCVDFIYLDIDNPQTDNVKRQLGYRVQPEFYLLDGAGKIIWKNFGYLTEQELENQLRVIAKK